VLKKKIRQINENSKEEEEKVEYEQERSEEDKKESRLEDVSVKQ